MLRSFVVLWIGFAAGFFSPARGADAPDRGIPDTLEQRVVACAACHGKQGEGLKANEYYPRIAGKPSGYLYNQLVNFRERRRHSPVMNHMVAYLSDAYLREIADYYAALPPTFPPPIPSPPGPVLARGEALMTKGDAARKIPACVECHGQALTGMNPAIPALIGLDAQYIAAQMGAWRNKTRRAKAPDCMASIASLLVPGDISALAAWLAVQSPSTQAAAPLPAGSLKLPMECAGAPMAGKRMDLVVLGVGLAIVAAATFFSLREPGPDTIAPSPLPDPGAVQDIARGQYLVRAGNCLSCHTVPDGKPFAGGRAIPTPFGTLYSSNITPDSQTGLGHWSADDFWRALHEGKGRDGSLLYPAFPYTNYTKVTREDSDAMFAYLRTVAAVVQPPRPHEMRFPYDNRSLLTAWRALYFKEGVYANDSKQSAQWNRGAYLVDGLGHCNACHATRNAWGAVKEDPGVGGGLIPMLNWYAPSLASSKETGLGTWPVEEIVSLLRTGVAHRGAVFGPMSEVVRDSLQHLSVEDVTAMAVYLKSQRVEEGAEEESGMRLTAEQAEAMQKQGAVVYKDHCMSCHRADGQGVPRIYPPFAGNQAILMRNPVNAIRITLNGGFPPSTAGNPRPYGMPPFAHVLNDDQVAAVVTYIRSAWGNRSAPVSPVEVTGARGVPLE